MNISGMMAVKVEEVVGSLMSSISSAQTVSYRGILDKELHALLG